MIHLTSLEKEIVTAMQNMHRSSDREGYLLLLILDYKHVNPLIDHNHILQKVKRFKYH